MSSLAEGTYLPAGLTQPAPMRDGMDAPYWEGTREHELRVQRCADCGTHQWGPDWVCHACQSLNVEWVTVEPKARIYSWQRVHHPVHPALADHGPYIVVLVELPQADNLRMIGNLLGDPMQDIVIGSHVEAVFEDHDNGNPPYTLVHWQATSESTTPAKSPAPSQAAEPPPLPDLPPVGPTLVERGDAEHYRSAAQRQRERTGHHR